MPRPTTSMLLLLTFALAGVARAVPPSSTLDGDDGALTWTVETDGELVTIRGVCARWTVVHTARRDLTPMRTEHIDADGRAVTIEYTDGGATVVLPERTVVHDRAGIWDGDTLDVRLGQLAAKGEPAARFEAIDTASGKLYSFESIALGEETCGALACTHVKLTLTGLLRAVGPKWHYWFASDGRLLRFEGPAGTFTAADAR